MRPAWSLSRPVLPLLPSGWDLRGALQTVVLQTILGQGLLVFLAMPFPVAAAVVQT